VQIATVPLIHCLIGTRRRSGDYLSAISLQSLAKQRKTNHTIQMLLEFLELGRWQIHFGIVDQVDPELVQQRFGRRYIESLPDVAGGLSSGVNL
jgi:hypothetical protein